MRHRNQRRALALPEHIARLRADGLRGRRARRGRRGARALHARVHVRLVVVTDVEHVIVSLEHPRQARHPDIDGAAITALADDPDVLTALGAQRGGDARRDGGRVPEQRVNPRYPPRALRVGRREHLQAAGRVRGDHPPARGSHRGVKCIPCAERLPAALASTVPTRDRVGALLTGLHRALLRIEQPVANGEAAGLVEANRGRGHACLLLTPAPRRPCRGRAECSRRADPRPARRPSAQAPGSRHPSPCPGTSTPPDDRLPRR